MRSSTRTSSRTKSRKSSPGKRPCRLPSPFTRGWWQRERNQILSVVNYIGRLRDIVSRSLDSLTSSIGRYQTQVSLLDGRRKGRYRTIRRTLSRNLSVSSFPAAVMASARLLELKDGAALLSRQLRDFSRTKTSRPSRKKSGSARRRKSSEGKSFSR